MRRGRVIASYLRASPPALIDALPAACAQGQLGEGSQLSVGGVPVSVVYFRAG